MYDTILDTTAFLKSLENEIKNASKIGQSIHFYGRERGVFFDVLKNAVSATMKDISVKKLGLQDLMDAKYAKDGIH
mgnify:CR=1 FL=1